MNLLSYVHCFSASTSLQCRNEGDCIWRKPLTSQVFKTVQYFITLPLLAISCKYNIPRDDISGRKLFKNFLCLSKHTTSCLTYPPISAFQETIPRALSEILQTLNMTITSKIVILKSLTYNICMNFPPSLRACMIPNVFKTKLNENCMWQ